VLKGGHNSTGDTGATCAHVAEASWRAPGGRDPGRSCVFICLSVCLRAAHLLLPLLAGRAEVEVALQALLLDGADVRLHVQAVRRRVRVQGWGALGPPAAK